MKKILFIHGYSAGDVLEHFGRSFVPAFAEYGVDLIVVNVGARDAVLALKGAIQQKPDLAFGFAGVGKDITTNRGNIWDVSQIPFISFYTDSPGYFFDAHVQQSRWMVGLYGFAEHLAFRQTLPFIGGSVGLAPPIPLPLGEGVLQRIDFKEKLKGDIIFLKNGNDPQKLLSIWDASLPVSVTKILKELSHNLTADLDNSDHKQIVQQVDAAINQHGLDLGGFSRLRLFLVAQLDDFVRRVKSEMLVRVLLKYPVKVYGANWDYLRNEVNASSLQGLRDYLPSDDLINQALAMFHVSPNTNTGWHDRQLRAFGAETFYLTNSQHELPQSTKKTGQGLYTFTEDSIKENIEWVLDNRSEVIERGRTEAVIANQHFSFKNLLDKLNNINQIVRFNNQTQRPAGVPEYFIWPQASVRD